MTGALNQHVWKGEADRALIDLLQTWVAVVDRPA